MKLHFVRPLAKYREFLFHPKDFFKKENMDVGVLRGLLEFIILSIIINAAAVILAMSIISGSPALLEGFVKSVSIFRQYLTVIIGFSFTSSIVAWFFGGKGKFDSHLYGILFPAFVLLIITPAILLPFVAALGLGSNLIALGIFGLSFMLLFLIYSGFSFMKVHKFSLWKAQAVWVLGVILGLIVLVIYYYAAV